MIMESNKLSSSNLRILPTEHLSVMVLAKDVSVMKCDVYQTCEHCAEGKIAWKPLPRKTEENSGSGRYGHLLSDE